MSHLFDVGYYNEAELMQAGFKAVGLNVKIAKNCTIVGVENISIGNNVRIDAYCTIIAAGGFVNLGSYIHIGSHSHMSGVGGITMEDFTGLSHGGRIYSGTDDYSGHHLTNPTVSDQYTQTITGHVIFKRHALVGSSSVVLPGVIIGEGAAVGAMSLVTKNLADWTLNAGIPAKKIKDRSKELLKLEKQFLSEV
jgi:galactoside O-acetyltransferase